MRFNCRTLEVIWRFLPQQLHASLCDKAARHLFGPGINFVIAIASPDAQRSVKMANLIDAFRDGVTNTGNQSPVTTARSAPRSLAISTARRTDSRGI